MILILMDENIFTLEYMNTKRIRMWSIGPQLIRFFIYSESVRVDGVRFECGLVSHGLLLSLLSFAAAVVVVLLIVNFWLIYFL